MRIFLIILVFLLLSLCSCDDSFTINDEWSDITIVYSVLNQDDTAHYIKINKAFLGDASAYEMAKIADSIQYMSELRVSLEEYEIIDRNVSPYNSDNWILTDRGSIILERTTEILKDSVSENGKVGLFSTEINYLYKTKEKLNKLYKYVLEIKIPEKDDIVTSQTILLGDLKEISPTKNINGYNSTLNMADYKRPYMAKWEMPVYGKIIEPVIHIHYLEIVDNISTNKYIDIEYGSQFVENIRMPNNPYAREMFQIVGGSGFYRNIGAKIDENINAKRKILGLDFIYYVGGRDLFNYMASTEAVSYGQYETDISNIINGVGLFAS